MRKEYRGFPSVLGPATVVVYDYDVPTPDMYFEVKTVPLRHFVHHSPTGFAWGYLGSGPADLALSILIDFFGLWPTDIQFNSGATILTGPIVHYQRFKADFIVGFPMDGEWSLTGLEIADWCLGELLTFLQTSHPITDEILAQFEFIVRRIIEHRKGWKNA